MHAKLRQDLFDRLAMVITQVLNDSGRTMAELDDIILVGGSCKMLAVGFFLQTAFRKMPHAAASPDEIVAMGEGIYAGIKERREEISDLLLTDICPFTMGIDVINYAERDNSIMSPIIERNNILPSSKKGYYTNTLDCQSKMVIKVYQGEEHFCRDSLYLGELQIDIKRQRRKAF